MQDIFEHTDYRLYLRGALKAKKAQDPTFTHRKMSTLLGLHTSNHILLVSQGKKNLSSELAQRLAMILGLRGREADYFLWMTLFQQAKTTTEKEHFWQQMLAHRVQSHTLRISESQYEYYSHWYNPVIRELVAIPGTDWSVRLLSQSLQPKVPAVQVRQSLDLLQRLGLIRHTGKGWTKANPTLATAPEVKSIAVFRYHMELMDLARVSLENDSGKIRNFSALTLELNGEEYSFLVEMLTKFRREALGICGSRGAADRIYQLNLQLFPVSKVINPYKLSEDEEEEP